MSETLVNNALLNNCFHNLKYIKKIGREKKILNWVFDFIGVDKDNRSFILEVKAVPLADYDDIYAKKEKRKIIQIEHMIQKYHIFQMVIERN